jgi:hypothetical protein
MSRETSREKSCGSSLAQLRLYARLSRRGRFQGCPKDERLWLEILEVTDGKGLRPDRRPAGLGGGWKGLDEFLDAVPPLLRNYKTGRTLDDVAQLLGMRDEHKLTEALRAIARHRWDRKKGRRGYVPIDDYDFDSEDPGDPYHSGEEDEWPEGVAHPPDSDDVPF